MARGTSVGARRGLGATRQGAARQNPAPEAGFPGTGSFLGARKGLDDFNQDGATGGEAAER